MRACAFVVISGVATALSCSNSFGQAGGIAAISGRDQLALHDLATGAELVRFEAPGGSSDLLALGSGVALSNHTAVNEVAVIHIPSSKPVAKNMRGR